MLICQAESIARRFGKDPVFEDLSFQIYSGERIGLVGPNGAGKTTLMKALSGEEPPDSGKVMIPGNVSVSLLRQFATYPPERTLRDEARRALAHLHTAYERMVEAGDKMAHAADEVEQRRWARVYDEQHELLLRHGGFDFDHRIDEVLDGLSFTKGMYDRPLASFSGGQQRRVLLAQLLLQSPDLMLLDEPTNHLDIATTEWLEDYLSRQPVAMIIVSHDRYFLDKTVNKVFELYRGGFNIFPGNYAGYLRQREERQKVAGRVQGKQDEQIARYEEFIRRNKAGQLSKQAKAREKMVERLKEDRVEVLADISGPVMGFGDVTRTGDIVFEAKGLGKAYGDHKLFFDLNFQIERGQRVGILGPNGAGKSTLLKMLLGEEQPTAGTAKVGHNVKVGYLDQELHSLPADKTPLDVVRPPWRLAEKEEPFRKLLARYGIGADIADRRLGTLSGGERTRVALAKICALEINALILDEPTNHLDLWAREALERSLQEFEGTILAVSHDRYFLNQTVDRLILIEGGQVALIPGNYDRYLEWKRERAARPQTVAAPPEKESKAPPPPLPAAGRPNTPPRKRKFPFRKTADIEADIAAHEASLADLRREMLDPDLYKDGRRVKAIQDQVARLQEELQQLMEHWEEAVELNPT